MRGIGHKESTTSGSPCKEHPHERSLRDSGCVGHKESSRKRAPPYDRMCRTGDRGCKCRKTAGEERPGFTGQDAG